MLLPRLIAVTPLTKFKLKTVAAALLGSALLVLIFGSAIAVKITITSYRVPEPEAIFVLGGNPERTEFAAQFSQAHPHLDIWISDYQHFEINQQIMVEHHIPAQQVHYDLCATDTVTNFTCTVAEFEQRHIRHLYLITADFHIARSQAISTFIFGSRGIITTSVSIDTPRTESRLLILRDCLRSLIWLVTGWSGASFNPNLAIITANQCINVAPFNTMSSLGTKVSGRGRGIVDNLLVQSVSFLEHLFKGKF